jgi:peptidoglycan/LPS O-acetylase OafA/YrhL
VILFFVISAFCLCLTMPDGPVTSSVALTFYIKRFFRIAPLFYVVMVMTLIRDVLVRDMGTTPGELLGHLTFTFNLVPGLQDSRVFAGWTIGVEMLFYLIFPALYAMLRGIPAKVLAYGVAGLSFTALLWALSGAPIDHDRYALLTVVHYLPVFLLGMVAFDVFNALHARGAGWRTGAILLAAGVLAFVGHVSGRLMDPVLAPYFWQGASYTLVLLGLAFCPLGLVVNRATQFLGRISYSIYLLHGPVILIINRPVYPRIYALELPAAAEFALCLVVTLCVTLAVSSLAYRFVERPGIALGRKWVASRGKDSRLAVQPG